MSDAHAPSEAILALPVASSCLPLVENLVGFIDNVISGKNPNALELLQKTTTTLGSNVVDAYGRQSNQPITQLSQVAEVLGESAVHMHLFAQIIALGQIAIDSWEFFSSDTFDPLKLKRPTSKDTSSAIYRFVCHYISLVYCFFV